MNMEDREVQLLLYRADAAETECQEWQYVADKLYRALVLEKNRRGVAYQDVDIVADAIEAYRKIA
jgi:hypothetical protein